MNDNLNELLFSKNNIINNSYNSIQYLLIQRKDSLSYVEFIRGKYNTYDREFLSRLIQGMTITEQERILSNNFGDLWKSLWGDTINSKTHKNDYDISELKFNSIKELLPELVKNNPSNWTEPEWGFPKGRRNPHETDLSCAIREFQEETGLHRNDFTIIQNTYPISETFFGSNQVHYCHKYYIAICNKSTQAIMNMNNPHMTREIGNIKWCSLDEAILKIRPDNVEKREILLKVGKIMRNFHPISTNIFSHSIKYNSRK
jgi:8-oxo-dGTP pyrophosphatase MutT (NUDIX family)